MRVPKQALEWTRTGLNVGSTSYRLLHIPPSRCLAYPNGPLCSPLRASHHLSRCGSFIPPSVRQSIRPIPRRYPHREASKRRVVAARGQVNDYSYLHDRVRNDLYQ